MLGLYALGLAYALINPSAAPAIRFVGFARARLGQIGAPLELVGAAEFLCNVAIFVPLPVAGFFAGGPARLTFWLLVGVIASAGVEVVQLVVLSGRTGSAVDVVANTTGTLLGAMVVWSYVRVRQPSPVPCPSAQRQRGVSQR